MENNFKLHRLLFAFSRFFDHQADLCSTHTPDALSLHHLLYLLERLSLFYLQLPFSTVMPSCRIYKKCKKTVETGEQCGKCFLCPSSEGGCREEHGTITIKSDMTEVQPISKQCTHKVKCPEPDCGLCHRCSVKNGGCGHVKSKKRKVVSLLSSTTRRQSSLRNVRQMLSKDILADRSGIDLKSIQVEDHQSEGNLIQQICNILLLFSRLSIVLLVVGGNQHHVLM